MNRAIFLVITAAVLGTLGLGYAVGWHKSFVAPEPVDPLEAQLKAARRQDNEGAIEKGSSKDVHDHDHDHAGEPDHDHIDLSDQAASNIGLKVAILENKPYQRTIAIPAVVVERPGISQVDVSAPLTGIVTKVFHSTGESVGPGTSLFQLRLTHEELVATQREYLVTLEELDVVAHEISRLETVTASGAIAGKSLLERQYEQQKLNASAKALREALLLHGLDEALVDSIGVQRKLVQEITVNVPDAPLPNPLHGARCCFTIQSMPVNVGKHVTAGDTLAKLTDYTNLYIEGQAFQRDAAAIENAAVKEWKVTAVLDSGGAQVDSKGLSIAYVANEVNVESRALHFYIELPNELIATHEKEDGRLYSQWKYRPGMRGELFVPAEQWTDQLIVPVKSVIQEGAESFIFLVHGNHYDRTAVHILQKDQRYAVIAENERIKTGEQYVVEGAYQMHLAIKNQSGGALDPHAGHNH
jgi:multidrug efflux pump subunit AcrA (membrane-fusion protein)